MMTTEKPIEPNETKGEAHKPWADIAGWEQFRREGNDPTQPIVDAVLEALND